MNKQSNYTELKAIVKTISKYIENVNPNTPYQQNLKRDIKHIINVLDEDNIESWITCTKYISENYAFILTHRGFSYLSEDTIRQQGKSWNYKNLTTMAQTLEEALKAECTVKSVIEAGIEYGVEKLIGWMIKIKFLNFSNFLLILHKKVYILCNTEYLLHKIAINTLY